MWKSDCELLAGYSFKCHCDLLSVLDSWLALCITLRTTNLSSSVYKCRGVKLKTQTCGLTVTLIDFTLSRLVTVSGDTAFCDLSADPALFQGPKGDCQV